MQEGWDPRGMKGAEGRRLPASKTRSCLLTAVEMYRLPPTTEISTAISPADWKKAFHPAGKQRAFAGKAAGARLMNCKEISRFLRETHTCTLAAQINSALRASTSRRMSFREPANTRRPPAEICAEFIGERKSLVRFLIAVFTELQARYSAMVFTPPVRYVQITENFVFHKAYTLITHRVCWCNRRFSTLLNKTSIRAFPFREWRILFSPTTAVSLF